MPYAFSWAVSTARSSASFIGADATSYRRRKRRSTLSPKRPCSAGSSSIYEREFKLDDLLDGAQ